MKYITLKEFSDSEATHKVDDILEIDTSELTEESKSFIEQKIKDGYIQEVKEEEQEEKDIEDEIEKKFQEKMAELEANKNKEQKSSQEKNIMETVEVKETKLAPETKLVNAFKVAKAVSTNSWTEETKNIVGQGETVAADGGALVDEDIVAEIYRHAMETAVVAPRVSQRPVGEGYNVLQVRQLNQSNGTPADYQGVELNVISEGATITPDKVAFKTATAPVNKLAALFAATNELEQDTPGLMNWVGGVVGEAFGLKLDDEILHGTDSLLTELVGDDSTAKTVVTPGAPTAEQVRKLYMANVNPAMAEWYMSGAAYEQIMGVEDTEGRPLLQPNYAVAPYGTIFGRPVNVVPSMKGTAENGAILFADMGRAYMLGTKGGIRFAESMHLYFNSDQNAYRWVLRVAGLPLKASALTLNDGRTVSVASQSTAS